MGTDDRIDVLLLRRNFHFSTGEALEQALRERLLDYNVRRARTPREEERGIRTSRVVVGGRLDEALLRSSDRLELLAYTRAGTGSLPLELLAENSIAVTNASGIRSPSIAEDVIGHVLTFARRLHTAWDRKRSKEWRSFPRTDLAESTVTIVGLGSIGQAVVDRLTGFDVDTIGVRYTPSKGGPTDEVVGFDRDDVHDALARTDYLVLATPLTEETREFVGADELKSLPPKAVLINVCRGEVVDTGALVSSIRSGSIRGAALDVTDPEPLPEDHPLWVLDNVVLTPHVAGGSDRFADRFGDLVAENVRILEDSNGERDFVNQVLPR